MSNTDFPNIVNQVRRVQSLRRSREDRGIVVQMTDVDLERGDIERQAQITIHDDGIIIHAPKSHVAMIRLDNAGRLLQPEGGEDVTAVLEEVQGGLLVVLRGLQPRLRS